MALVSLAMAGVLCLASLAWANGTGDDAGSGAGDAPAATGAAGTAGAEAAESSDDGSDVVSYGAVSVDRDGGSAVAEGVDFGVTGFTRAQVGSNRAIDGVYYGYTYLVGTSPDVFAAVFANMEGEDPYVVLHVPASAESFGVDPSDPDALEDFKTMLYDLDLYNANGGVTLAPDQMEWHVTADDEYAVGNVVYSFGVEAKEGRYYVAVAGADGSDVTNLGSPDYVELGHCAYGSIVPAADVDIELAPEGFDALVEFLTEMDYSPLWVTLKTTGVAIVFIFVLGLLAAYWSLTLSKRAQSVVDSIFTIPMVLPPTVCGFLLLMLLGRNTLLGQWFVDIGFPLIFSWPATVIASVVVAFPLMYRSARGAFEGLDQNMLDAARTLGWSNFKIFRRLMLPLAWSSIAAGTVLAFARALGEFGATLFLAGNYAGITQTIPLAIYFQWMNGRTDVALFWTGIIIVFSFFVILFINIWSGHTTKYRKRGSDDA